MRLSQFESGAALKCLGSDKTWSLVGILSTPGVCNNSSDINNLPDVFTMIDNSWIHNTIPAVSKTDSTYK